VYDVHRRTYGGTSRSAGAAVGVLNRSTICYFYATVMCSLRAHWSRADFQLHIADDGHEMAGQGNLGRWKWNQMVLAQLRGRGRSAALRRCDRLDALFAIFYFTSSTRKIRRSVKKAKRSRDFASV